ncbi:MAG: DMT family transporter [Dictyoglomus sp.]|nr:DMT family transporter [Dictyoglomus sp.]MCX7942023.1 DMT family transporter [Dictyoglomaceae bacterium]MDW8188715.1 DMT family transporter [Dictyoglomus sp.]
MIKGKEIKGIFILTLVTLIWGSTFSMSKISLQYVSPIILLSLRFTLGTISLFVYLLFFSKNNFKITKSGIILGVINFLAIAFQTFGLKYTSATKTAFITGISVLFVPFGEKILFKNKISKNVWIAVVLAILGLFFLTVDFKELSEINIGDFLVLLCAITYTLQILFISYVVHKADISNLAFVELLITSLLSWFFAIPEIYNLSFENLVFAFPPILYLGIIATALTLTLQLLGQRYLSPSKSAIIYNLEPVFAFLFARIFLNERLKIGQGIGAILIILSLFLSLPQFSILNKKKRG